MKIRIAHAKWKGKGGLWSLLTVGIINKQQGYEGLWLVYVVLMVVALAILLQAGLLSLLIS